MMVYIVFSKREKEKKNLLVAILLGILTNAVLAS
jgi:hypothetical protein